MQLEVRSLVEQYSFIKDEYDYTYTGSSSDWWVESHPVRLQEGNGRKGNIFLYSLKKTEKKWY